MIRSIELQNFQSHKHTKLTLGQVTLLTGMSSSGKTAVICGLEWLFYGDWDDSYRRDEKEPTAVAIEMDDDTRIIRMRKGNENLAVVIHKGETFKYKSFGAIIPGIFEIINMQPVKMLGKEINLNFSIQDEPHFLLSDSKPAKAQWLGRLYGAHIINAMLSLMNKDKREANAKTRSLSENTAELERRLAGFKTVDAQEASLGRVKVDVVHLESLAEIHDSLVNYGELDLKIYKRRWLAKVDLSGLKRDVTMLGILRILHWDSKDLAESLQELGNKRWLLLTDLDDIKTRIESLASLKTILNDLEGADEKLEDVKGRQNSVVARLKGLNNKIKDHVFTGGKCPLCLSKKKISAEDVTKRLGQLMGRA